MKEKETTESNLFFFDLFMSFFVRAISSLNQNQNDLGRYHDIVDEYCKDLYEKTFWALKQEEVVQLAFFLDLIPKNLETAYHKFRIVSKFTDTTELIALKLFAEAVEKKKDE